MGCMSGSGGCPTFSVTPASQNAALSTFTGNYTITMVNCVAGAGGQTFLLSDGGGGGTFSGGTTVTIPQGQTSATFQYKNGTAGTYPLSVLPGAGVLNGEGSITVQAIIGASASPTGFTLTPSARGGYAGFPTPLFFINLVGAGGVAAVAGVGGQQFTLSDGGAGGLFLDINGAPITSVTVPQNASSIAFSYENPRAGTDTLTASAAGNPYATNQQTAQAVIHQGAFPMGSTTQVQPPGTVWGKGYLTVDGVLFGTLQNVAIDQTYSKEGIKDPTFISDYAVGIKDLKTTVDAEWQSFLANQWAKLCGGTVTALVAVTDPNNAWALTAVQTGGSINVTTGNLNVGYIYTYTDGYGRESLPNLAGAGFVTFSAATAAGSITFVSLTGIPAGATAINIYTTATGYATSGAAIAAPMYFYAQVAVSGNVTGTGTLTAALPSSTISVATQIVSQPPAISTIGNAFEAVSSYGDTEPPLVSLHIKSPANGQDVQWQVYGVSMNNFNHALQQKAFMKGKFKADVYGNPTDPRRKLWDVISPL